MQKRMNKSIAGYHILMILSAVDFRFHVKEDLVIRDFLAQEFPFPIHMDKELSVISNLKMTEWKAHYLKAIADFENEATEKEKNDMLQFAVDLVKADDRITKEENEYLTILFNILEPEL